MSSSSESYSFPRKVLVATAIISAVVLLILFLGAIFRVILIIIAAILVAAFFRGIGRWIANRTPLSRGWAVLISVIGFFVLLGGIGWTLSPYISQQFQELSQQLPNSVQDAKQQFEQRPVGKQVIQYIERNDIQEKLKGNSGKFFSAVFGVFGVLGDIYIILFMGFLITAGPKPYQHGIIHLVPKSSRKRAKEVLDTLGVTLRSWLAGKLLSMLIVAVFTWLGLWLVGVPLALILGIIAGILAFVPNFGPLIALLLGVMVAAPLGMHKMLLTAVVYIVAQIVESNFLTPMIQRHQVSLPMAMVLVAQLVLGVFAGILGLVLATPLFALVMVTVKMLYVEDVLGDTETLLEPEKRMQNKGE
ncbi:putative PurR-regulated permease PerM [Catalinimonas alkaloidigena]|uniref:AI-2E family transporter n=1 Tax=Catalinimonas alkaloidigena TaxID=1075417 RepID=UPI0024060278|nr:AI-2E family transporter [Catalinimonas alkaloidigena]MDF9800471.1 putative PurR-regulated permease PerM [Catalinimonas alkaloidigena]